MTHNWQQADWPEFRYETDGLSELLLAFADHAGCVGGLLEGLPEELSTEAVPDLFESIHPFEDGNGRIGRAIAEKALSQGLGRPVVLILSQVIDDSRSAYYAALKSASRSNEVSGWVRWFVGVGVAAQRNAEARIRLALRKSRFFGRFGRDLNERQLKVLRRMFEAGPGGFTGGLNTRKYIALTGTSKATATRDLQRLAELGALIPAGGGRSVRYDLGGG